MKDYWNNRFLNENEIWGQTHSKSAELCLEYFSKFKIKNILIPGVGYGRNAQFFEKKGFSVEGVEISDQAIKMARDNGLTFPIYEGSALEMPFNNKKYDGYTVLMYFTYFVKRIEKSLLINAIIS